MVHSRQESTHGTWVVKFISAIRNRKACQKWKQQRFNKEHFRALAARGGGGCGSSSRCKT